MNYNFISNIIFWSALSGFIGTVLIFFFGLPPKIDQDGHIHLICEGEDRDEKRRAKKFKFFSYIGIALLATSFFLQLISIINVSK